MNTHNAVHMTCKACMCFAHHRCMISYDFIWLRKMFVCVCMLLYDVHMISYDCVWLCMISLCAGVYSRDLASTMAQLESGRWPLHAMLRYSSIFVVYTNNILCPMQSMVSWLWAEWSFTTAKRLEAYKSIQNHAKSYANHTKSYKIIRKSYKIIRNHTKSAEWSFTAAKRLG